MELTTKRRYKKSEYTIGNLFVDGLYFCDTLEDAVRDLKPDGSGKIKGKTAIPAGRYEVTMTYSPKFKRRLPLLLGVPFFEGVRIHAGNTAKDTEGCLLVGKNRAVGKVLDSRKYERQLVALIEQRIKRGEKIYIEIC